MTLLKVWSARHGSVWCGETEASCVSVSSEAATAGHVTPPQGECIISADVIVLHPNGRMNVETDVQIRDFVTRR